MIKENYKPMREKLEHLLFTLDVPRMFWFVPNKILDFLWDKEVDENNFRECCDAAFLLKEIYFQ